MSGQPIPGWKDTDEVESTVDIDMGEYVIYNDWVGQVRSTGVDVLRTCAFISSTFAGR